MSTLLFVNLERRYIIKTLNKNNPLDKMITKGTSTLSNEELIAVIIGKGNQRFNGIKLGTKIIDSVGNPKNLLDLNYHELVQMRSINSDKACSLIASFELAKRFMS